MTSPDEIEKWEEKILGSYNTIDSHGRVISTSFSHIFSGGYAAGYYGYKWAEVLASDAFSVFQKNGIFDPTTAQSFLRNILEMGGTEDPEILYRRFKGSNPDPDALLRNEGLKSK